MISFFASSPSERFTLTSSALLPAYPVEIDHFKHSKFIDGELDVASWQRSYAFRVPLHQSGHILEPTTTLHSGLDHTWAEPQIIDCSSMAQ